MLGDINGTNTNSTVGGKFKQKLFTTTCVQRDFIPKGIIPTSIN